MTLPQPFIDLSAEVNGPWDRGLLGIALDPDFVQNRLVYLLYTVDPVFGAPDESPFEGTFSRVTRYEGTVASGGNVADLASRFVLVGETWPEGIPVCEPSHTIGTVQFGHDGSLFISAGDGAHFDSVDSGGQDADCFGPGKFPIEQDIGAFRSQYLGSLAGKVLRIDPATGDGLSSNPFWTGDGTEAQSKVWVSGLRNPFRFSIRPEPAGAGAGPGAFYIGDVGWNTYEEINVVTGGENLGWPCREGFGALAAYVNENPDHSGCDSIETPANPGPLTDPLVAWHHFNGNQSTPPGFAGRCAVGGVFYEGLCYPELYQGAYFFLDYINGWIRVIEVDANNAFVDMHAFAENVGGPADLEADPFTGDLFVVKVNEGWIQRISYLQCGTCDAGAVNVGCGALEDVLELNGMTGGDDRTIQVTESTPLSFEVSEPGSRAGDGQASDACIYAWLGEPAASDTVVVPKDLGLMCFGPLIITTKNPEKTWNAIGFENKLGTDDGPGPPPVIPDSGSFEFLAIPGGFGKPLTATFQGLIEDDCSRGVVPFSVTNGFVLNIVP